MKLITMKLHPVIPYRQRPCIHVDQGCLEGFGRGVFELDHDVVGAARVEQMAATIYSGEGFVGD